MSAAAAALVPGAEADMWAPVALDGSEHLARLRDALQVRAKTWTMAGAALQSDARPELQYVSLDSQTGMKTSVFEGGVSSREPFDASAMKDLASPAPALATVAH
jgi:hypothetical protein